jgi:hypothetical protein
VIYAVHECNENLASGVLTKVKVLGLSNFNYSKKVFEVSKLPMLMIFLSHALLTVIFFEIYLVRFQTLDKNHLPSCELQPYIYI